MTTSPPQGYLGADARIRSGPALELVEAGYGLEIADAALLHRGLALADIAHLVALVEAGVVPPPVVLPLAAALLELLGVSPEDFPYDVIYGDAYNSRERELERRLGVDAGWLHTGRTRREAGRIAFRLALRDRLVTLHEQVTRFAGALADRAVEHAETLWNDTTYLQPAQPSTFGHYLLGFATEATRHLDRVEAAYRWADASPGGVGGVGGTRVPLDRARLASLLGFGAIGAHTRDAMWATDGLVDAVVAAAQSAATADRLAEDLEIFTSPQFSYVTLDASLCRASVQMPQKRNPYALAVIRGGASTLVGRVAGALATQRTPSARTDNWLHAYGETAGAVELSRRVVALAAAVAETLAIDVTRLQSTAGADFSCATDLTDALVLGGTLDYRSAYRVVGRAVTEAMESHRSSLTVADLPGTGLDAEAVDALLDPAQAVAARTQPGGSAPARVREHAAAVKRRVADGNAWATERRRHHTEAESRLLAAVHDLCKL
jgi:argininosuccinate lyase